MMMMMIAVMVARDGDYDDGGDDDGEDDDGEDDVDDNYLHSILCITIASSLP